MGGNMPYTIAVSNEKGGVAKTTTTMSLGASLGEQGLKVLLIDLDPQGNLTLATGLEPKDVTRSSADVLLDGVPMKEIITQTNITNIDIVPCNSRMEMSEQSLPLKRKYTHVLREAIEKVSLSYDFIMLDCPPALGAITVNALTASDLLIIPTQAEYFSAYALRDMMNLIRKVRTQTNPALAYRILITLLDQRNRTHRTIREQLQQTFGAGLFETVIEIDTRLRESPIVGMPITQYKPNSRGSQQYRVLAQELIQYVQQANTHQA
jgi:chromosome partitioning protein